MAPVLAGAFFEVAGDQPDTGETHVVLADPGGEEDASYFL